MKGKNKQPSFFTRYLNQLGYLIWSSRVIDLCAPLNIKRIFDVAQHLQSLVFKEATDTFQAALDFTKNINLEWNCARLRISYWVRITFGWNVSETIDGGIETIREKSKWKVDKSPIVKG